MANEYLKASDFFKTVRPDERVYFLVRHGERGHILPDDPDHGAFVGLTERGREQALNLGRAMGSAIAKVPELRQGDTLASHSEPVRFRHSEPRRGEESSAGSLADTISFFSSPVGRCMETARNIALGIHAEHALRHSESRRGEESGNETSCCHNSGPHLQYVPHIEPLQPLAEFFVEHYEAYMETHRTGFYQGICRWLDGTANSPDYVDPAYFPLAKRSQEMLDLMLEKGKSRINVFCSHDAWIVPCLAHFCGLKFTPQLWMNFLTGVAVVVREGSTVDRIVAVTGVDDGNLVF